MLEKIKYINHRNEIIEFGQDGYYVNYNDLRDYAWDYTTDFNRIGNFSRGIAAKSIPLFIFADTEEKGIELKNRLFEVIEKDVLANSPGALWIGNYFYKCYIIASNKSEYLLDKRYLALKLSVVSDSPVWINEKSFSFYPNKSSLEEAGIKNYKYDYPYNYSNGLDSSNILNDSFMDVNFKLIIYGPCINPTLYIKGHMYQVNTTLMEGEYLTVNSLDKTIYKIKKNGEKVNEFSKRNKTNSVFKTISEGRNTVTWNGTFGFDIVLIEERSEPRWT